MKTADKHGPASGRRAWGAGALRSLALLPSVLAMCSAAVAANYPPPVEGDFILRDFRFASGESLPELRIHYRTFG
ncbi:MAG TPA: hypothetical protein VL176_08330, partial [Steroidobacteraceae bacterium]|nr:hypothetical protein [Steroidobacteraceae bacterium]